MGNSRDLNHWDFLPAIQPNESRRFEILDRGIFLRVILDKAHSLGTSETPNGKFRMANGMMI